VSRMRSLPILVSLVLSVALVTAACAQQEPTVPAGGGGATPTGGETGDAEETIEIAGQEAADHGSEDVTGESEIELELDDFYFEPTVLEGEAGQRLSLTLFNEGEAPHTFTIDEQTVDEELQPGDEDVTVEVTFPDSGALVFYCRFHAGGGMVGGLSVGGDLGAASGGSGTSGGSGGEGETEDEDAPSGPGY
jgi:plastocyanin